MIDGAEQCSALHVVNHEGARHTGFLYTRYNKVVASFFDISVCLKLF